jgi:hypothetical protein
MAVNTMAKEEFEDDDVASESDVDQDAAEEPTMDDAAKPAVIHDHLPAPVDMLREAETTSDAAVMHLEVRSV